MSKNKILNKNIFWKRAKKVIPGGNMLFSKRPEVLLPENWPSYFSKSKGVQVWDLNNNKFVLPQILEKNYKYNYILLI